MFESLQDRLGHVFKNLTGRGSLSQKDTQQALTEIKAALLEADVSLPVVRGFIKRVSEKAVGAELIRSVKPGQMVVKLVHDELVSILGGEEETINLNAAAPVVLLLVGLQGSGKTTTSAKLARRMVRMQGKKVLLASLDTQRPGAQEQLRQLAEQIDVDSLPIIAGQSPTDIAKRAMLAAKLQGADILILDSAGRTHIDESLMHELQQIKTITSPHETLLVADSLTGQDAVNLASSFNERMALTGIILTRIDGDGRGGAALSMRAATGLPIKAVGVGEKLNDLEDFYPKRIADRILGMGDIVSLVEKAAESLDQEKAASLAKKMQSGKFDFNDLASQLQQMQKLGGLGSIMGMLPGLSKMKNQILDAGLNDKLLGKQLAIISSMSKAERANPDLLKHSRKQRIAKGSGTDAAQINKLIKMQRQMGDMMKSMGGKGKGGAMGAMMQKMLGGKGLSAGLTEQSNIGTPAMDMPSLEEMTKSFSTKGFGGLPNNLKLPGFSKNK